jgi:alpha-tubulin suppressor-like RCC1 family protein
MRGVKGRFTAATMVLACALLACDGPPGAPAGTDFIGAPGAALAVGAHHSCALNAAGSVGCWGWNDYGQLGFGTAAATKFPQPTAVSGLPDPLEIVAGRYHTCARLLHGQVRCWGMNMYGQLGDGTRMDRASPVDVSLPGPAAALYPGGFRTCARLEDGRVFCWGQDADGVLQTPNCLDSNWGDAPCTPFPLHAAVFDSTISLAMGRGLGNGSSSCGVVAGGEVRCWGTDGNVVTSSGSAIGGLPSATAVTVGEAFACALIDGGTAACWGHNQLGELGDGTFVDRTTPAPVAGLTGVVELVAGGDHICARDVNGGVICWGSAISGEIGRTAPLAGPVGVSCSPDAAPAVSVPPVMDIDAGGHSSCARGVAGDLLCWGEDSDVPAPSFHSVIW